MAKQPRQQRIESYGEFRPTGGDNSISRRMQALAGLGETVAGVAEQFGRAKATAMAPEQAAKDAREAAKEGEELKKRDPLAWGAQAYNSVAVATYEANLKVDLDEAMLNAYKNNPDNIEGYQKLADAAFEGLTSKAPESVKANVDLFYRQRNSKYAKPINDQTQKNIVAQQRGDLEAGLEVSKDTISNLIRNGNEEEALEARLGLFFDLENAVKNGVITPLYVEQQKAAIDDDVAKQAVLGQLDRTIFDESLDPLEQIQKGEEFISDLIKSDIPDLNSAQKDALVKTVNAKVQDKIKQYTAEQNQLSSKEMLKKADLVQSIKEGNISSEDAFAEIDAMFKEGLISTEEELIKYRNYVNTQFTADITKQKNISNTMAAINGNPTTEPLTQGAVDDYYETIFPALPDDPMDREVMQANIVEGTRYVPTAMKTELRNNLVSGNGALVKSAANTMDRILQIAGMGNEFTPRETAFAEQVAFNMEYLDAEKAIANANDQTNPANASMVESRKKYIKDNKKSFENKYADEIESEFTGWFQDFDSNSIGGSQMIADYKELVESYFLAGSTEEGAKSKAMSNMKANWTNSSFGLMRNAPELYYTVDGSVEYIKDDIYNALQDEYAAQGVEFEKSGIFLQSDDITSRLAVKGTPDYSVIILTKDGTLLRPSFIADDGTVFNRWNPTDEYQALLKSEKKRIEEKGDEILADRPYQQRTFQKIAKQLGVNDTPKESTGGRFKGGSAELDRKFRTQGLAESLDTIGSALDRVTYTPMEMLEDVAVKIGRKSDKYIASLKKDK